MQQKQTLQEENQSLTKDLNQAVTEKMQYQTRIDQLRQELTQKSDCEHQLKDLREQRDTFEHQLRELRGEKEVLERQLSQYQQYQGQVEVELQDKHTRMWATHYMQNLCTQETEL